MNTPTILVGLLTLWLVMGLGFLAKYANVRKKGGSHYEAWTSYEGVLFVLSIAVPLAIIIHKSLPQ